MAADFLRDKIECEGFTSALSKQRMRLKSGDRTTHSAVLEDQPYAGTAFRLVFATHKPIEFDDCNQRSLTCIFRHQIFPEPSEFQSGKCSGAGCKLVGSDTQTMQHRQVQIRQRWRVVGLKRKVLTMSETAAGQKHRQVFRRVCARVAKVAAEKNHGSVQQTRALLFRIFELQQQLMHDLHFLDLHCPQLGNFLGILAVM